MPKIHLFNDNGCRHLYPFHLVEGVEGIRHGAFTQEERWRQVEEDLVQRGWQGDVSVNSRWIPDAHTADDLLTAGLGSLAFNGLRLSQPLSQSADPITAVELEREPRMIAHANDLFSHLGEQLLLDVDALAALWNLSPFSPAPPTHTFGAADQIMVAEDAVVRAATLDASSGPILIGPGVTLEPGSHIEGPALIHRHAVVRAGAHVRGATVIGPHSKVGGELSNVNFQGWANKAHGGFLGNSVIGRWCNLGAGTVLRRGRMGRSSGVDSRSMAASSSELSRGMLSWSSASSDKRWCWGTSSSMEWRQVTNRAETGRSGPWGHNVSRGGHSRHSG